MAKEWIIKFEVICKHKLLRSFPMDMLRYDHCHPSDSESAGAIADSLSDLISANEFEPVAITLTHYSHGNRNWEPTNARWESYGYRVIKIHDPKSY